MSEAWAKREDWQSPSVIEAAHSGLTVKLVATPVEELMTCLMGEPVAVVMERNTEPFDFLPVKDSDDASGHIIGLFHAAGFIGAAAPEGPVADHVLSLTESHVIGGDAGILDFVKDADKKPCRLVFSGPRISGLVSLSDLQKLPVRAALFAVITGLEMTMTDAIRRKHPDSESWLGCLGLKRRDKIRAEIATSHAGDGYVDSLLFTQFCDKAAIIKKSVSTPLSKNALKATFTRLERLRNKVAHANDYASTREEAEAVCRDVRALLELQEVIAGSQRDVESAA